MPLQQIINGESGLNVRTALMEMLTELYGSIPIPIKLPGVAANTQAVIPASSVVWLILIQPVSGAPVVSAGTMGGGQDLLPSQPIVITQPIQGPLPYDNGGTIYFTIAGGTVNISILVISQLYE